MLVLPAAITVTNPLGTDTVSSFYFIYTTIPPVVLTSFSPDSATEGATVTITGQNLSGITAISFGGTPAQSFRIFSDSIVYVTVGAGSTGTLVVSGNNGTASLPGFFYIAPPPPPAGRQHHRLLSDDRNDGHDRVHYRFQSQRRQIG